MCAQKRNPSRLKVAPRRQSRLALPCLPSDETSQRNRLLCSLGRSNWPERPFQSTRPFKREVFPPPRSLPKRGHSMGFLFFACKFDCLTAKGTVMQWKQVEFGQSEHIFRFHFVGHRAKYYSVCFSSPAPRPSPLLLPRRREDK